MIVRENTEDLYAGIEHMVGRDAAESIKIITRAASERIARFAFEYAVANGRRKVTAVHKANIMKLSDGLFLETCRTVAADYEGRIEFEDRIVDNMCMQLVQKPDLYDVLVLPNLYGDIVQRPAARASSAAWASRRARTSATEAAVFEPVHGSAPKYAGLNKANPTALILSRRADAPPPRLADGGRTGRDRGPRRDRRGPHDDLRPRRTPARHVRRRVIARLAAVAPTLTAARAGSRSMTVRPAQPPRAPPRSRAGHRRRPGFGDDHPARPLVVAPAVQGTLFTSAPLPLRQRHPLDAALRDAPYEVDGYLSPLFSPLIAARCLPWLVSPGLLILWIPLGFRATCYYYRKAYYRFYFADPPGCAVGEPTIHRRYAMETRLPFILQNLHRYFLYLAFIPLFFLWLDALRVAPCLERPWRIGLGSVILFVNVALLTGYSLSCHSLRHLVGGRLDCFSCTRRHAGPLRALAAADDAQPPPHGAGPGRASSSVTLADVYVRLLALGVIVDPAIRF